MARRQKVRRTPLGRIYELPTPERVAKADVVAKLEQLLEQARAGHIVDMMAVGTTDDGCTFSCWTESLDFKTRLAMLETLKLDWYMTLYARKDDWV